MLTVITTASFESSYLWFVFTFFSLATFSRWSIVVSSSSTWSLSSRWPIILKDRIKELYIQGHLLIRLMASGNKPFGHHVLDPGIVEVHRGYHHSFDFPVGYWILQFADQHHPAADDAWACCSSCVSEGVVDISWALHSHPLVHHRHQQACP